MKKTGCLKALLSANCSDYSAIPFLKISLLFFLFCFGGTTSHVHSSPKGCFCVLGTCVQGNTVNHNRMLSERYRVQNKHQPKRTSFPSPTLQAPAIASPHPRQFAMKRSEESQLGIHSMPSIMMDM